MREFSLIAALIALLATTVVLAQEDAARLGGPVTALASAEAGPPEAPRNPFAPLGGDELSGGGSSEPLPEPGSSTAPPPAAASGSGAVLRLNGILYCESKPLAVISDLIVGQGDEVGGMRVLKIERDRVLLAGPGGAMAMTPLRPEAHPAPREAAARGAAPNLEPIAEGLPPAVAVPAEEMDEPALWKGNP